MRYEFRLRTVCIWWTHTCDVTKKEPIEDPTINMRPRIASVSSQKHVDCEIFDLMCVGMALLYLLVGLNITERIWRSFNAQRI